MEELHCCKCDSVVCADLVTGKEIYPHIPDLHSKPFYRCPGCANYVGCHPGTTDPLGCIPTPKLRKARSRIHARLDPLWQTGKIGRRALYEKLSDKLGREYHTAEISSEQEARAVYLFVVEIEEELKK